MAVGLAVASPLVHSYSSVVAGTAAEVGAAVVGRGAEVTAEVSSIGRVAAVVQGFLCSVRTASVASGEVLDPEMMDQARGTPRACLGSSCAIQRAEEELAAARAHCNAAAAVVLSAREALWQRRHAARQESRI